MAFVHPGGDDVVLFPSSYKNYSSAQNFRDGKGKRGLQANSTVCGKAGLARAVSSNRTEVPCSLGAVLVLPEPGLAGRNLGSLENSCCATLGLCESEWEPDRVLNTRLRENSSVCLTTSSFYNQQ